MSDEIKDGIPRRIRLPPCLNFPGPEWVDGFVHSFGGPPPGPRLTEEERAKFEQRRRMNLQHEQSDRLLRLLEKWKGFKIETLLRELHEAEAELELLGGYDEEAGALEAAWQDVLWKDRG